MIKLSVADYCQECKDFDPKVIKSDTVYTAFNEQFYKDTTVICEHWATCRRVAKFVRNLYKDETKD